MMGQNMEFVTSSNAKRRWQRSDSEREEIEFDSANLVQRLSILSQTTSQLLEAVEEHAVDAHSSNQGNPGRSGLLAQLEKIDRIGVRARSLLLSDPPLQTTKGLAAFGHEAIEATMMTLVLLGADAPRWVRSTRQLDLAAARARCFVELMHELSEDGADRTQSKRLTALRDTLVELGECAAEVTLLVSTD